MKKLRYYLSALFLAALTAQASSAETWKCRLSPREGPNFSMSLEFEVKGDVVLRSPDDLSSYRLPFVLTTNSASTLTAIYRSEGSTIYLIINKLSGEGIQIGGLLRGGWLDTNVGPCTVSKDGVP